MGQVVERSDEAARAARVGDAVTWVGLASRALDAACESWGKLARLCVLALCLAVGCGAVGALWWFLRLRG